MSHINTEKSVFTFYFKNGLLGVLRQKEQKKQKATEIFLRLQDSLIPRLHTEKRVPSFLFFILSW